MTPRRGGFPLPRWQLDANSVWRTRALGFRRTRPHTPSFVPSWKYVARNADGTRDLCHPTDRWLQPSGARRIPDGTRPQGAACGQMPPLPTDNPLVWWDIQRIKVLNGQVAKEAEDEKHICPLSRPDRALYHALVEPWRRRARLLHGHWQVCLARCSWSPWRRDRVEGDNYRLGLPVPSEFPEFRRCSRRCFQN